MSLTHYESHNGAKASIKSKLGKVPIKKAAATKALSPQAKKARLLKRVAEREAINARVKRMGTADGRTLTEANAASWCQAAIVRSGHSFAAIAEDTGMSPSTVSRLLYGKTKRPAFTTVIGVLKHADVTLEMRA